ncbi:AraC family transcriptional regulator [Pseudarthrobacter sp. NPDC058329]|uniref:AraC family transcriptional regulator n=1 Tax=Pseudarthrobacter sp. NPDC058329 TaxID=3346448 RepID=UPI0036D8CAAA
MNQSPNSLATPKPLDAHPVVHTSDIDAARDAVTGTYLPNDMTTHGDGQLNMTLNAWGGRDLTLGYLTYQAETKLRMPPPEEFYHVNLTTAGGTEGFRADGKRAFTAGGQSGLVLLPHIGTEVKWGPDAEQIILRFSRDMLENFAADLMGQSVDHPIGFDFGFDLSTGRGASLYASAQFMAMELNRPGGITENPLALEQLESFVMSNLLLAVPNNYSEVLLTPAPTVNLGRLKPVVDFIEANADEPITPAELARVGMMSIRTLHASFQQSLGTSPMEHLRRVRMERVRAELISNKNPDLKITDVATRWGFYHPSRFAARYRQMFGELPSETLQRHA